MTQNKLSFDTENLVVDWIGFKIKSAQKLIFEYQIENFEQKKF
jgi:hypothetical protein